MATKQRQQRHRGSPEGGRSPFQRRMSWNEVETAFDHLFDVGLDDDEARRLTIRFQRARSQLLPIFSSMVVSPFERERVVALAMLERIGGRATVDMLDDVLTDVEVHDAYKLDVRQLRASLEDPGKKRPRLLHATELDETEEDETPAVTPPPPPRQPAAVEASPAVFDSGPDAFLAALTADTPGVLAAFAALTERRRLSFIDRVGRLRDPLLLGFLLPLLEGTEWALVQSVLTTLGNLGLPEAVPAVERLAGNAQRKRVQMRAQRVLEQLHRASGDEGEPQPAAEPPSEGEPQPEPSSSRRPRPRRDSRRRRGEPREGEPEPQPRRPEPQPEPRAEAGPEPELEPEELANGDDGPEAGDADGGDVGLLPAPLFTATWPLREAWTAPARLPRLRACLATGIGLHGEQRLFLYRTHDDDRTERLELVLSDLQGWLDATLLSGSYDELLQADQEHAAGARLLESTAGYVRGRVEEAQAAAAQLGLELPRDAEAALTFIGAGRRTDLLAALPDAPSPEPPQEDVERLLAHPLFAGWHLSLDPQGAAVGRWLASSRKRSASRLRRKILDDVLAAWIDPEVALGLALQLRRQAVLLARDGEAELASVAVRLAARLGGAGARLADQRLLREVAYQAVLSGLDARRGDTRRRHANEDAEDDAEANARSTFRRSKRRR